MPFDFKQQIQGVRGLFQQSRDFVPSQPSFVDDFLARTQETGFMQANRWLMMLFPNENVREETGMNFVPDVARLAVTCRNISINEKTWYTTEENYIVPGAARVMPYRRNTNNSSGIRLQFLCGADAFEKEFFDNWYRYIQSPDTKQFRFYDDYALRSEIFLLLLPKNVLNFEQAINAMYSGEVTGVRFTEVYPYAINLNSGTLNQSASTEPMVVDVSMMYHDMVPLREESNRYYNSIPMVTDTGYPTIDNRASLKILKETDDGLQKTVNGFIKGQERAREDFKRANQLQQSLLRSYSRQLSKYKNENFPRAVDGRAVYRTPGHQNFYDLGLSVASNVQGFFGIG